LVLKKKLMKKKGRSDVYMALCWPSYFAYCWSCW